LQTQIRELYRLLGKKTLEAEILKEALEDATGSKKLLRLPPSPPKEVPDEDRGGSDRGLALEPGGASAGTSAEADRRPPLPDVELVAHMIGGLALEPGGASPS
jgi:hypothetical protein